MVVCRRTRGVPSFPDGQPSGTGTTESPRVSERPVPADVSPPPRQPSLPSEEWTGSTSVRQTMSRATVSRKCATMNPSFKRRTRRWNSNRENTSSNDTPSLVLGAPAGESRPPRGLRTHGWISPRGSRGRKGVSPPASRWTGPEDYKSFEFCNLKIFFEGFNVLNRYLIYLTSVTSPTCFVRFSHVHWSLGLRHRYPRHLPETQIPGNLVEVSVPVEDLSYYATPMSSKDPSPSLHPSPQGGSWAVSGREVVLPQGGLGVEEKVHFGPFFVPRTKSRCTPEGCWGARGSSSLPWSSVGTKCQSDLSLTPLTRVDP